MSEWTSEWPNTYVSILVCSRPQCVVVVVVGLVDDARVDAGLDDSPDSAVVFDEVVAGVVDAAVGVVGISVGVVGVSVGVVGDRVREQRNGGYGRRESGHR